MNDEADRFFNFYNYIKSGGKMKNDTIAQVILINSEKKTVDDDDWIGLIQTFKRIINDKVMFKMNEMDKKIEE